MWGRAPKPDTPEQNPAYRAGWEAGRAEMASHFKKVPPDPHFVYVEKANSDAGLARGDDVQVQRNGLFLSYQNAWAALAFVALLIWWGRGQFADVQYEIKDLRVLVTQFPSQMKAAVDGAVRSVTDDLAARLVRVEDEVGDLKVDLRKDHDTWCIKTEQVNSKLGWRCAGSYAYTPDEGQPQLYYAPPTLPQSWKTETAPKGPLKEANAQ